MGMGFHPMNDLHQCLKMVRLFVCICGFVSKQWGLLLRPYNVYKFMTLSPKDYYLIPGNGAIKLVVLDHIIFLPVLNTITQELLTNSRQQRWTTS